jgi:curli production assembly/transport component CsgG
MIKNTIIVLALLALTGCASVQKAGYDYKPKIAENKLQREFDIIPPPANGKLTVAVYQFSDKTGQRKQLPGIASFSTAVTQGADSLLIRALQDVGQSRWFDVVERGNIDALTKERLIITQMRQAYEGDKAQRLMPLAFAGIILEGGVIGYDTGLESGGVGYNFLGIGPTTQYSKDIVTVSLRAISVNTGKILATVTITKVIYSTSDTIAIFKSIDPGQGIAQQVFAPNTGVNSATSGIFQFETGFTINEATTTALKTTIEATVLELINEGQRKGVWDFKEVPPVPRTASEVVGEALGTTAGVVAAPIRAVGDVVESALGGTLDDNITKGWTKTSPSRLFKPSYDNATSVEKDGPVTVAPAEPNPKAKAVPNIPLGMSPSKDVPADAAAKTGVVK